MRRRTRVFVLLLVASLVVAVAPAASGGSHSLKATFEVDTTVVTPPLPPEICPDCIPAIEARCPEGWPGWIFEGSGDGTLTVGKTTYEDAEFAFEHCSRWLAFDPERATGRQVGKSAAGEMTIATSEGSLNLEYSGTWVMYDFEFAEGVPEFYTSDLNYRYAVVGGTGVFEGASRGHGHISMTLGSDPDPIYGTGWLAGSLK